MKLEVIKYWVPMCPGCDRIKPMFEDLQSQYGNEVEFKDYNFKEHRSDGPKYKLSKMPCVVFIYPDGNYECVSGVQHPDTYKSKITDFLEKPKIRQIKELLEEYKDCIHTNENMPIVSYGAEGVGNGWYDPIESCFKAMREYNTSNPDRQIKCGQIKEKFGELRFYDWEDFVGEHTPESKADYKTYWAKINAACDEADLICEKCGSTTAVEKRRLHGMYIVGWCKECFSAHVREKENRVKEQ